MNKYLTPLVCLCNQIQYNASSMYNGFKANKIKVIIKIVVNKINILFSTRKLDLLLHNHRAH